jgi:hypothetical protein
MSNDYVYDLETYPNVFTMAVEHADYPVKWAFEISQWRNDSREIVAFLDWLRESKARMVGFNNLGFDYPILHTLYRMGNSDALTLYNKAQAIIGGQDDDDRWAHQVNPTERIVEQIDLYKIHHFDNKARATGLKALEFNMRSDNIQDLPFKVGTDLTPEQLPTLKQYNAHDVDQTKKFLGHTADMIHFREKMTALYPSKDWINFNDTKIGKEFFTMKLEEARVACYDFGPMGRTPRQTPRPVIHLKDAVLPWIRFEQPEFTRVLEWFKAQSITETKGVFNDIAAHIAGFDFVFGLGGIHGSVESEVMESDENFVIVDLDVASYYPNLAITNRFYPAHLGKEFCVIYKNLYEQRKTYPKKSAESAMLKLALNGVYGDSNNKFSVFYDPLFTMSVTLNGQLLLCWLAEKLMTIGGLRIIQVNTDGLTVRIPRAHKTMLDCQCMIWQQDTGLQLEEAIYSKMFIRDVNNYLAVYEGGKTKRKGCYEWDVEWHQNAGALVVAKVAEQVLVHGAPIRETVEQWPDIMDFMLRTKVPRSGYLQWGDAQAQNTSRYYVAKGGKPLTKWLPPLNAGWRPFAVESGWNGQVCNDIKDATLPVDFDYYCNEVEKICLCLS